LVGCGGGAWLIVFSTGLLGWTGGGWRITKKKRMRKRVTTGAVKREAKKKTSQKNPFLQQESSPVESHPNEKGAGKTWRDRSPLKRSQSKESWQKGKRTGNKKFQTAINGDRPRKLSDHAWR